MSSIVPRLRPKLPSITRQIDTVIRPLPQVATAASSGRAVPLPPPPASAPINPLTRVLVPTALALLLGNMDRICLSVAIMPMAAEFGWPASMQGIIQSSFLWGYTATQLAGGSLADRLGGKRVLAGGIAWFSAASLLLPLALCPATMAAGLTVPVVLASRFLTGLGEGVALPSMSNLVAAHVPPAARARALGFCFSGFHCGNLAGLVLSPLLLLCCGWRGLFCVLGALGLPLLLLWLKVVPDTPATALAGAGPVLAAPDSSMDGLRAAVPPPGGAPAPPSLAATQTATTGAATPTPTPTSSGRGGHGGDVTAAKLLASPATWAIIVATVVNNFGYFIYLNWMPTYFAKALGFDLRASSFTALLPWLAMAVGSPTSGFLADWLVDRGVPVIVVRKALQTVAFLVPAAALLLLAQPGVTPQAAVAYMTLALGTTSLGLAGYVANMSDVAPRHAGKMYGLCSTFGCLAGVIGVTAVGFIVEATQSFAPVFLLTAALYVVGILVWNLCCTTDTVFH